MYTLTGIPFSFLSLKNLNINPVLKLMTRIITIGNIRYIIIGPVFVDVYHTRVDAIDAETNEGSGVSPYSARYQW
jgi:hypothetical protein